MWATGPGCVFPYLPDWLWRSQHPRKSRHRQKTEKKRKKTRKEKKETKLKNKPCKKNLLFLSRQKSARWLHFRQTLKGEKIPQSLCGPAPKQERTETSNRRGSQTPLASGRHQGRQSHSAVACGEVRAPPFLGLSETARTFPSTEKYQDVPPPPLTSARPEPEL